jgi:hypothetical protein
VVFAKTALTTTVVTTLGWVIVTLATRPEPDSVLLSFYRKARPDVRGWKPVAQNAPEIIPTRDLGSNILDWVLGCAMVYSSLFGIGRLLIGPAWKGVVLLALAAACGLALYRDLSTRWGKETFSPEPDVAPLRGH